MGDRWAGRLLALPGLAAALGSRAGDGVVLILIHAELDWGGWTLGAGHSQPWSQPDWGNRAQA